MKKLISVSRQMLGLTIGVLSSIAAAHAQPGPPPGAPGADYANGPDTRPVWQEHRAPPQPAQAMPAHPMPARSQPGMDPAARASWLSECQRRLTGFDPRPRRDETMRARSECESYYDDYYARAAHSYGQYQHGQPMAGYVAYAPAAGCCMGVMAPAMQQRTAPQCTETVEETVEYVQEPIVRTRYVPQRPARRVVPDKRVRIVPDKRVRQY